MTGTEPQPPPFDSGPNDHGAAIVVVTYSFMFISLCFAILRVHATIRRKREFGWDDITLLVATVILIPQSVVTEKAVCEGLGRHIETVVGPALDASYKLIYISQLLGIAVQWLAKLSVVILIARITAPVTLGRTIRVVEAAVSVWAVFALLTIAFQCGMPHPWVFASEKCAAQGKVYYLIVSLNITTDAVLACFFIPVIWQLQMARSLHYIVSFLFALRLIVCAASIAQICVLRTYLSSPDHTFHATLPTITNQLVTNLSLITAGIPRTHRFLADLQTGQLGTRLSDHEYEMNSFTRHSRKAASSDTAAGSSRYTHSSGSNNNNNNRAAVADLASEYPSKNASSRHREIVVMRPVEDAGLCTRIYATPTPSGSMTGLEGRGAAENEGGDGDGEGEGAGGLSRDAVYRTREISMRVEYDGGGGSAPAEGDAYAEYARMRNILLFS